MMAGEQQRRGSILVGVLWILVFLGFLAVVLRIHVGSVVASVRVTEEKAAARMIAEAGLARGAGIVLAAPFTPQATVQDEVQDRVETATGRVTVIMTNEARRIDLNTAEKPLVIGALRAGGAEPALAETLATKIVARRGETAPTPQLEGAKATTPPPEGTPANTDPIQTVSQVALIEGMPESVALAIAPYTTVSSGLAGVRLDALDDAVLRDIPGLPANVPGAIAGYRKGNVTRAQLDQVLASVSYNTAEKAQSWRARLRVELPSGHIETHEALIMISPDDDAPYRILDWRRLADDAD